MSITNKEYPLFVRNLAVPYYTQFVKGFFKKNFIPKFARIMDPFGCMYHLFSHKANIRYVWSQKLFIVVPGNDEPCYRRTVFEKFQSLFLEVIWCTDIYRRGTTLAHLAPKDSIYQGSSIFHLVSILSF